MHVRWSSLCIFHDNSASGTFRQIYSTQPTHGSGIRVTAISWLPASIAGLGPTFIQSCAHIQCVYDEWFTAKRNSIATVFFYNFYHKYYISFVKCQMLIGLQKLNILLYLIKIFLDQNINVTKNLTPKLAKNYTGYLYKFRMQLGSSNRYLTLIVTYISQYFLRRACVSFVISGSSIESRKRG